MAPATAIDHHHCYFHNHHHHHTCHHHHHTTIFTTSSVIFLPVADKALCTTDTLDSIGAFARSLKPLDGVITARL
jgi:uncharacterized membrane protein YcgQ (UPF0703/DUF1980 family)